MDGPFMKNLTYLITLIGSSSDAKRVKISGQSDHLESSGPHKISKRATPPIKTENPDPTEIDFGAMGKFGNIFKISS